MFKEIDLLTQPHVEALRQLAARTQFVDGRITNPHNVAKNNLQLHDQSAYQQSSQALLAALMAHEDFRNFTFPAAVAPPMMTRYEPDMRYGAHADAAILQLPTGPLRSDLSCTIFLSDPASYAGGALTVTLGTRTVSFKGQAGTAIVYPSDMLHEVEPVTTGARLVAITFIQSRIRDNARRETLYELNEVAALEGLGMAPGNYVRLSLIQQNLLRFWADKP